MTLIHTIRGSPKCNTYMIIQRCTLYVRAKCNTHIMTIIHIIYGRGKCNTYIHYQKFWVLQLSFAIKIQLHATHAIANLCSYVRQLAHDMQLHATLRMQHVYTVLIYMFIHTYKSKCSCTLCATLLATRMQLIKI